MVRSTVIVVSEDPSFVQKTQQFGQMHGVTVQTMTTEQWDAMQSQQAQVPSLISGTTFGGGSQMGSEGGAKVLPFPGSFGNGMPNQKSSVATINQLESVAIENAIQAFKGNLTEAAKALGIGRATLYRKVKQYNIDPTAARKKKAA
jgi:transcriptional regulator with GAF, ATPase, and Fis domain